MLRIQRVSDQEYFANYFLHTSDVTFDIKENQIHVHQSVTEPWKVTLVDTGENAGTGGRLQKCCPYLADDETFCMTYGDGVGNVDIARFGSLDLEGSVIRGFQEKPIGEGGRINGGFFVLKPSVLDEIP